MWRPLNARLHRERLDGRCRWPGCRFNAGRDVAELLRHERRCHHRQPFMLPEVRPKAGRRNGRTTAEAEFEALDASTTIELQLIKAELGYGTGTLELTERQWMGYVSRKGKVLPELGAELDFLPALTRRDFRYAELLRAGEHVHAFRGPPSVLQALYGYFRTVCRLHGGVWSPPAYVPDGAGIPGANIVPVTDPSSATQADTPKTLSGMCSYARLPSGQLARLELGRDILRSVPAADPPAGAGATTEFAVGRGLAEGDVPMAVTPEEELTGALPDGRPPPQDALPVGAAVWCRMGQRLHDGVQDCMVGPADAGMLHGHVVDEVPVTEDLSYPVTIDFGEVLWGILGSDGGEEGSEARTCVVRLVPRERVVRAAPDTTMEELAISTETFRRLWTGLEISALNRAVSSGPGAPRDVAMELARSSNEVDAVQAVVVEQGRKRPRRDATSPPRADSVASVAEVVHRSPSTIRRRLDAGVVRSLARVDSDFAMEEDLLPAEADSPEAPRRTGTGPGSPGYSPRRTLRFRDDSYWRDDAYIERRQADFARSLLAAQRIPLPPEGAYRQMPTWVRALRNVAAFSPGQGDAAVSTDDLLEYLQEVRGDRRRPTETADFTPTWDVLIRWLGGEVEAWQRRLNSPVQLLRTPPSRQELGARQRIANSPNGSARLGIECVRFVSLGYLVPLFGRARVDCWGTPSLVGEVCDPWRHGISEAEARRRVALARWGAFPRPPEDSGWGAPAQELS